jgi:hypothetical protein
MDSRVPKKQTTAAKKARAAARAGEKYTTALRRQLPPGREPSAPAPEGAPALGLDHRGLRDDTPPFRIFRGSDLLERIGGQAVASRLVDLLYAGISADEELRPLFPRDLADSRSKQKAFFTE